MPRLLLGSRQSRACGMWPTPSLSLQPPTISARRFTEKPRKCPARCVFLYQNCPILANNGHDPLGSFLVYLVTGSPTNVTQRCVTPSKSQVGSVGLSGSSYQSNQFLSLYPVKRSSTVSFPFRRDWRAKIFMTAPV